MSALRPRSGPLLVALTALALVLTGCGSAGGPGQRADEPGSGASPAAALAAAPTPRSAHRAPSVRVAATGDIACAPGRAVTATSCRQGATARLVGRLDPTWVLALGDLQYERGSRRDFDASYDRSWGALKAKTLPVPGNHEYLSAGAKGYYSYFGRRAPGYSAKNIGSWRVYLLNSNCDVIDCAREARWLGADLEARPRQCTAMVMHHPRYSSGREHGSDSGMARFWDVAYAHHVDLALAGHEHDYERFAPMDGRRHLRPNAGITSFVVGTGGRSLYHRGQTEVGSRYFRADTFGALMLSLGDGGFSWRFRTIGGEIRDAGSRTCR